MGEIVNQINLSDISAALMTDGNFRITLYWTLNGGMPCSYKGSYVLILYENALEKERRSIEDTQGQRYVDADFSISDISKPHHIQLKVADEHGGAASEKIKLILDYCTEVCGTAEQGNFRLFWKTQTSASPWLLCTFSTSRGVCNQYYINPRAGSFCLTSTEYTPGDTIDITLQLTDKDKVLGPESRPLHFYTEAPELLEATFLQGSDSTRLSLLFRSSCKDLSGGKICLISGGISVAAYPVLSFSPKGNGTWSAEAEIPCSELSLETLTQCAAALNLCNGTEQEAESIFSAPQDLLPLGIPSLQIESADRSKLCLRVLSEGGLPLPSGYELSDGQFITQNRFSTPYNQNLSLRIRARYDWAGYHKKGPWSSAITAFSPGYYLVRTDAGHVLKFCRSAFEEESLTYTFSEELFQTPPDAPIKSGPLRLTHEDSGSCCLDISSKKPVTRADYADFLKQISDPNTARITPYGFYRLCDVLLRIVPHITADTAFLLCAFEPKSHTADLRPGMVINISTALYQPQYDPQVPNTAGFSAMFTHSFPLSLGSGTDFLDFDRFVGIMAENISTATLPDSSPGIIYVSGTADLAAPSARHPYYRILYPSSLIREYNMESPYPSDNIVLLAADSYSAILSACEALEKDPGAINNLPIPLIMFKGRSTLSLHIPVLFNGQKLTVAAGSTLQEVLQQNGIFSPEHASLFRRFADGSEMPVYLKLAEGLPDITLLAGDRIECR